MREIHDLLNTRGEEQNITAQKTALNDVPLSLLTRLVSPLSSSFSLIRRNVSHPTDGLGETQNEADAASLVRIYTATGNALPRSPFTVSVFTL